MVDRPLDANALRRAFTGFFFEHGHVIVPSLPLIPNHQAAPLFTNAGMNQFLPYFLGEEIPPFSRATSVQKCVRIRGKHDDIELIGRSTRHVTFFEMLGNFSFGDYFKAEAIAFAWEFVTEVLQFDSERIWVTVHLDDDEAAAIWHDQVGVPAERIQRLGEDNFWSMGDTGPCGPDSELFYDKGEAYGAPGGPAQGGEDRYAEFWNLVFMQYDQQPDGRLDPLPKQNIDTGMGLERTLMLLQTTDSVFEIDSLRPIIGAAEAVTGRRYGDDAEVDVVLRILGDHARTMSFLVNDGVFPSNEDRGYVLRRIIRRAVRQAYQLGVERLVTPALVTATVEVMGDGYPELRRNHDFIQSVIAREEERFRHTLRAGLALLDTELEKGALSGEVAFRLHDTHGFPIELTRELAAERGASVDLDGFELAMAQQRERARADAKGKATGELAAAAYKELLESFGPTEFTGYAEYESHARVLAVLQGADKELEIFLDRTPFYAEGGGQVGDTGVITTETGRALVLDTTAALPGLHRHRARITEGGITAGQDATATIDAERRDAIRRNHTGTHLLHWALREVLGTHVKQQGSLVAPDRLRFDFSHYEAVTPEELVRVEDLANARILADEKVRAYETSKAHAEELGAIAFFGDKYGEFVRVVEAGSQSRELCGGTHVSALGMIGPVKIVSEGSIGSNTRRLEAVTGTGTIERSREDERLVASVAEALRTTPGEVPDALDRLITQRRALDEELKALRARGTADDARGLAAAAADGLIVARRDGLTADQLRELALATRAEPGVRAVVLAGTPDGERVSLVSAVAKDAGLVASDLIAGAARIVGGGAGRSPELAMAGGRDVTRIDDALAEVRATLQSPAG
jgi:alanyl-tRNA synthetase